MNVAVVGLGKLGAPLAAVMAAAGHSVVGVDRNEETVAKINRGVAPVEETGLAELLRTPDLDLAATMSMRVVAGCDVIFVIVPTPSDDTGVFVNEFVLDAIYGIGNAIRNSHRQHVVVVSSTVMPGTMDGAVKNALIQSSGRRLGSFLGLCYSPEFIALGSVIHDLRNPDMVLIGESDKRAGLTLELLHRSVVGQLPPVIHLSLVDAELAKVAVNAYVTMKVSFANNLSEICEELPGADASQVARAVGWDRRVGGSYLQPALAFGGPCFPRDTRAFAALAGSLGVQADLATATDYINHRQTVRLVNRVAAAVSGGGVVAVLGLAYKVNTAITEESPGMALIQGLTDIGIETVGYDPVAQPDGVDVVETLEEALADASVVVVTTPWPEFASIVPLPDQVLIDCWGIVDAENVVRVGRG